MRDDLLELGEQWFEVEAGLHRRKTFGCPSWYVGKRMFAFLYEDALAIKAHPDLVLEKICEDATIYAHFNPGDGIMKNWLMITHPDAEEYAQDRPLIDACLAAMRHDV